MTLVKNPLSGVRQFPTTESPLKMMKNASYFMLIALSVEIFQQILSWLFGYVASGLMKKDKLISKLWRHTLGNK